MIRPTGRLHAAVVFACLAASALIRAQQAGAPPTPAQDQRPPVFRGGANFVYVDAYPRLDGRLVEGLRADDFQIFEDGTLQKIETFELIRSEPNTPDADRRDPNTKAESDRQAADPHNRLFVIYFDPYHTTFVGAYYTKTPLLDFLNRTMGTTDLFGVMWPNVPVSQLVFGRRTETLTFELTKYFDWAREDRPITPDNPLEARLFSCGLDGEALIALHREDLLATSLADLMIYLRGLRDERKNLLFISEGWVPQPDQPGILAGTKGAPPRIGTDPSGRIRIGSQNGQADENWCNQQRRRLASLDLEQRFRNLLTLASQANVSFYPIDVGGLKTNMPDASMGDSSALRMDMLNKGRARLDTLKTLAENTDGMAIVDTNGLAEGFRRISDELSAYYLLGYSSTNQNLDGRFHKIDVKVARPRVSVSARRGYMAASAAAVEAEAAAKAVAKTVAVVPGIAEELARPERLRSDTEMLAYGVASKSSVSVVVEIASARLSQWASGADLRLSLSGAKGAATATGTIEPGTRATIITVPLPEGGAGPWRIRVVATRGANEAEDRIDVRSGAGPLLGVPVAFRGTASARVALQPVADFQFRRTERIHVEWPVLKALDQRTARLLDRRGQPLPFETALTDRDVNGMPALAADLNLAALGAGDYVIEVLAGSGTDAQRALLGFRVIR